MENDLFKVLDLYEETIAEAAVCANLNVGCYFDFDSFKDLKKKLSVLKRINNGFAVPDDELVGILEKYHPEDGDEWQ